MSKRKWQDRNEVRNMQITRILAGPVRTNCYLIFDEEQKNAIIVDPADEAEKLKQKIREESLYPCAILLTHGHFDHIKAVDELRNTYHIPVYCHVEEKELMGDMNLNLSSMFGKGFTVIPDQTITDQEIIIIADFQIQVLHTPGHTKGSVCYYFPKEKILISGDTLFRESVGRTDFPTGNAATLKQSIEEKLFCLEDDVRVYPGHDEATTIRHEKNGIGLTLL